MTYKPIHTLQQGPNSFKFYYQLAAIEKIKEEERKNGGKLYRVASYGLPSGIAGYHGFQTADMAYTFYPFKYQNFWTQVLRVGPNKDLQTLEDFVGEATHHVELQIPPSYNLQTATRELSFNPNLLALINVKYILSRVSIAAPERYGLEPLLEESMISCQSFTSGWDGMKCRFEKFLSGPRASVYRVTKAAPRFFIVHKLKLFDSGEKLDAALREDSLDELTTHLYLTRESFTGLKEAPLEPSSETASETKDEIESSYTPDRISLRVTLKEPGYLIMTENYSERWSCLDQKVPSPMVPAYGAFRAIALGRGSHEIDCHFSDVLQMAASL